MTAKQNGTAHLCIHVGTIHVHLATVLMDDIADIVNALLIDSMCGGVCHHQCCQPAGVNLAALLHALIPYAELEILLCYCLPKLVSSDTLRGQQGLQHACMILHCRVQGDILLSALTGENCEEQRRSAEH